MKNRKAQTGKSSGFTLIELLTVIAIIGILAAILIPGVSKVREVASKQKSASNMKQIALAYNTYSSSGGRVKIITKAKLSADSDVASLGQTVHGYAAFLAKQVDLYDAGLWMIDSDPNFTEFGGTEPVIIGSRDANGNFDIAQEWGTDVPVGYDVGTGQPGNAPTSTTPLLWTRGLTTNGTWPKDSPWGRGGHIVYLDGHVMWYPELGVDSGQLVDPDTGNLTTNIQNVIPSANILRAPE